MLRRQHGAYHCSRSGSSGAKGRVYTPLYSPWYCSYAYCFSILTFISLAGSRIVPVGGRSAVLDSSIAQWQQELSGMRKMLNSLKIKVMVSNQSFVPLTDMPCSPDQPSTSPLDLRRRQSRSRSKLRLKRACSRMVRSTSADQVWEMVHSDTL